MLDDLLAGAHDAFRAIVPHGHDRVPLTWNVAWIPFACYAPFFFLAYLARRPDTHLIRLLLLPSVITLILVAAYHFTWRQPELNVYNWGQCCLAAVVIAKSLEYSLTPEGMLKVGEAKPGILKGKGKTNYSMTNGNGSACYDSDEEHIPGPPETSETHNYWLYDAIDLAHTCRGLQWQFGQGMYIPPHVRPLERHAFLQATLKSFIKHYLTLDLLESLVKLFPGVGSPVGGSIFYPSLTPVFRYTVSTAIHIMTGYCILSGFCMVYDLITLVAVGLCNSPPHAWPPVVDRPWLSESMHEFWAKRWHQILRQTFLVFGGCPGKWLGGNLGMLFGTFIASGLFHECAMYSMNRGYDHSATLFFAAQGPVLVLERLWRKVTGRRVGGWPGTLWVYFIMFIVAQPMVNAWHRRGLGGGMVIPPFISPFRIFVLPVLQWLANSRK